MEMKMRSSVWPILYLLCLYSAYGRPDGDGESQDYEQPQGDELRPIAQPQILTKGGFYFVPQGGSVTLPCQIINKDNEGSAIWNLNNKTGIYLDNDCFAGAAICDHYKLDNNFSLTIDKITPEFAGNYFCMFRKLSISHFVGINTDVEIGHTKKTVEAGEDIILPCNVTGFPVPTVTWHYRKNSETPQTVIGNTAMMTIPNAKESNSGVYTCSAKNSGSPVVSKSIVINVVNGIGADQTTVIAAENPEKTELCCNFDKYKSQISWSKNGNPIQESSKHQIKNSKRKTCLVINKVDEDDIGTYSCQVIKDNSTPLSANINVTGQPSIKLESVHLDASKNPIGKWKVKTFSPLTKYEISVRKTYEQAWQQLSKVDLSPTDQKETIEYSFADIQNNGVYDVEIAVQNKYGVTKSVFNGIVTIDQPTVIMSEKISTTGAAQSIRMSAICIVFAILMRLWC